MKQAPAEPVSLACAVLTVSDTRGPGDDTSGNLLAQSLAQAGHQCVRRDIVKDDLYQIRRIISDWIADPAVQVILTSGGTGFSHKDTVPEAIGPLLDRQIPGFGELFRQLSYEEIGSSALQSRALAATPTRRCCSACPAPTTPAKPPGRASSANSSTAAIAPAISPRTSRIAKTTDPMLDFDHAQTLLANAAGPLDRVEDVALADLAGRVLARDLTATVDIPRRQQRDGWLRAARGRLERRRAPAGAAALLRRRHARAARPGHAIRLFTGSLIPEGADVVVMQEDAEEADGHVRISRPPALGQHIRLRGEDTLAGAPLLAAGTVLEAAHVALLASQGMATAPARARLRVGILTTGDELVPPGAAREQIYNSNGPMLAALARGMGASRSTCCMRATPRPTCWPHSRRCWPIATWC